MDKIGRILTCALRLIPTSIICGLSFCFLLSACHPNVIHPRNGTTYDNIQDSLQAGIHADQSIPQYNSHIPSAIRHALLPVITPVSTDNSAVEHRFDVTADKMPVKAFFMGLVDGTPYNMVINPNVNGQISLNLKHVTIAETMQVVKDVYGYNYRKTSFGYEVLPAVIETQLFNINYLDVQRSGKSVTELSSGQISEKVSGFSSGGSNNSSSSGSSNSSGNKTLGGDDSREPSGSSVKTTSKMNFWQDLEMTLKAMVGTSDGRSVVLNRQAGVVIVHAYPLELHQIARYLDRIQSSMNRQVILEAKILEVHLSDEYQAGIDWNAFGKGDPFTGAMQKDSLNNFGNIFSLKMGKGDFNILIKLLQKQGNVQVLSSPRISTVNNQKAVIKVGQDEFFVTGVSTQNTVIQNTSIPSQDVSLTPFFSGITLDVTPQISRDGSVVLHIHPSVSKVQEQERSITLGQTSSNTPNVLRLPLALSSIRESDNIVRAQNGQIVVIGGLMTNNMTEDTAGVPVLSRIPVIGALFRSTHQSGGKTELVILLRPIIVDKRTWSQDLEKTQGAFTNVKRGFHDGGLADVFGNEGEYDHS
jgi:MSHA biogenesis protein MshL